MVNQILRLSFLLISLSNGLLFGTPDSVSAKLQAQYATLKFAPDKVTATQVGAILSVQKGGITASTAAELLPYSNTYKNGRFSHGFGKALLHNVSQLREIQPGDRVYITKLDIKDSRVSLTVETCTACDGSISDFVDAHKAEVTFPFPKGFLESATFEQVQQMIDEVFTIAVPYMPAASVVAPPAVTSSETAPQPATKPVGIQLGQDIGQVVAAVGEPDKVVDLGSKKIYLYKDLKITFLDGKVADVQ